jgi:superfamily II DNA or RNA helicase
MCSAPMRLGLTATPPEEPAALSRLAALLGPVVFHLSIDDLAGDYLASYRIISIQVDLDLEERGLYEGWMSALESTSVSDIATLTVGSATSVKVLPGILQRGHHYVARIQATTAALVPRGRSNVLTGMISVSP